MDRRMFLKVARNAGAGLLASVMRLPLARAADTPGGGASNPSAHVSRGAMRIKGFEDAEFDFQLLRSMGMTATGGGAIGECLGLAASTKDGNPSSWVDNFASLAERVAQEARRCLKDGHWISARDLFGRASMYYRAAEYYADLDTPRHDELGLKSRDAFHAACPLFVPSIQPVAIAYDPVPLPGYFAAAPDTSGRNKTLIIQGGFDSSGEELFFQFGVEALKRGFHIFFFDGPGETGVMRLPAKLPFRPDYEVVHKPIVDYLLSRDDVDPKRLALLGISFGGYLAPRAAAFEPRIRALIADSPVIDWKQYLSASFSPEVERGPDFTSRDIQNALDTEVPARIKQTLIHCFRKFGADAMHAFLARIAEYRLTPEMLANIKCPVLACVGEGEGPTPRQQCQDFAKAVGGPATTHLFTIAWGADAHCQVNNIARFAQVAYDWLDIQFK
jgi:pimeloyl-ACP methyl ester carboxylesterase